MSKWSCLRFPRPQTRISSKGVAEWAQIDSNMSKDQLQHTWFFEPCFPEGVAPITGRDLWDESFGLVVWSRELLEGQGWCGNGRSGVVRQEHGTHQISRGECCRASDVVMIKTLVTDFVRLWNVILWICCSVIRMLNFYSNLQMRLGVTVHVRCGSTGLKTSITHSNFHLWWQTVSGELVYDLLALYLIWESTLNSTFGSAPVVRA